MIPIELRIKKIVEPFYSVEALSSNDQYIIGVEMIIDATGMMWMPISSIELILENGEQSSEQVQYGILEAIIEATFKWEFTQLSKRDGR